MALSFKSFAQWTQDQATVVQASARSLVDFTTGSIERVLLEANSSVALWMQWLILLVLRRTRLATSTGADIDSFVGDFSLTRLQAVQATGLLTFTRFTVGLAALIQPGAQAKTADGTQLFTVTTDTSNGAWSTLLGGYVLEAGATSVTVPVLAVNAGVQGNVTAGSITLLTSAIPGVDTVSNASAFTNGVDAESDAALQARFPLYLASLVRATVAAVGYAVASVQQGLTYSIVENQASGGGYQPGNFLIYVDDGSGAPSTALRALVYAAVDQYRPLGSTFAVFGPSLVTANVAFTITAAAGYSKSNLLGPAVAAVTAYINALPMGSALPYSRIAQIVYDISPGIANVTAVTVNSATADVGGTAGSVVRAGTVVAS